MSTPEDELQEGRKKKTWLLFAGGAVSLLLPLGGVAYIKLNESRPARSSDGASSVFEHREGGDAKVVVTQQVTINPGVAVPSGGSLPKAGGPTESPVGSSLDFIKGNAGGGYYGDKKEAAPPPAQSTAPAVAAAPAPEPEKAPAKPAKGGKKTFYMPKLSGTKSLSGSNFKSNMPAKGGPGQMVVADPQSGGNSGGQDMNALLKNIPGGINNPDVQNLIKKNQKK